MGQTGFEDSTNVADGVSWDAGGGLQREWENGLSLGLGAYWGMRPEQPGELSIPLLFKWRISERLRFVVHNGIGLSWDATGNGRTWLQLGFETDHRTYRLQDFRIAGLKDVSVEETTHLLELKLSHQFDNGLALSAAAGYTGDREMGYWKDRERVGLVNIDQGWSFSLGLNWRY